MEVVRSPLVKPAGDRCSLPLAQGSMNFLRPYLIHFPPRNPSDGVEVRDGMVGPKCYMRYHPSRVLPQVGVIPQACY